MKKIIKNINVSFNLLVLTGIVFFSSCAREKGAVSYNSEKLRKQSWEIENTKPSSDVKISSEEKEMIATPAAIGTKESSVNETTISSNIAKENKKAVKETKAGKLSPVQKIMAKKLAKTLNPNETLETKRGGGLDQNLKLAIIFGIIGLILTLFGWPFYLIGVILLIIGLVFLLLWVLNQ